jgi:hypothetical protein
MAKESYEVQPNDENLPPRTDDPSLVELEHGVKV